MMGFGVADIFVAFIVFSTLGWLVNNWIRARHGYPLIGQWDGKAERTGGAKNAALRAENARLAERVEASEDRIAVLERIVTDRGYDVAHQIEALRDERHVDMMANASVGTPTEKQKREGLSG